MNLYKLKNSIILIIRENDHPLSKKKDSNWNNFFKELELYEEV